jgi:hypothetical protein
VGQSDFLPQSQTVKARNVENVLVENGFSHSQDRNKAVSTLREEKHLVPFPFVQEKGTGRKLVFLSDLAYSVTP